MSTISIPITDERLAQLRVKAQNAGVTPEEFLSHHVEQLLQNPDPEFLNAAQYVLKKNAELYRRLA